MQISAQTLSGLQRSGPTSSRPQVNLARIDCTGQYVLCRHEGSSNTNVLVEVLHHHVAKVLLWKPLSTDSTASRRDVILTSGTMAQPFFAPVHSNPHMLTRKQCTPRMLSNKGYNDRSPAHCASDLYPVKVNESKYSKEYWLIRLDRRLANCC